MDKPNKYDDNIDDIMASIMGKDKTPQHKPSSKDPLNANKNNSQKNISRSNNSRRLSQPDSFQTKNPSPAPRQATPKKHPIEKENHNNTKSRKRRSSIRLILAVSIVSLIGVGTFLFKDKISEIVRPPSPFSEEVSKQADTKLYYPTKLPGSFKMETNSISQDNGVVIYAITDESGNKINVSVQKKPDNLNLDPVYSVLSNVREIHTKFGTVKVGQSDENNNQIEIANTIIDGSWLIINSTKGTLQDQDLVNIINSFSS